MLVRADATRNAAAILTAARAVVGERGIEAPMSAIAERAGVAVGTLYRHHPTKQDLVAAVVADSLQRVTADAEAALRRVEDGEPAGAVLTELVGAVAEVYVSDRAFKEAAGSAGAPSEAPRDGDAVRAWSAVAELLARAQSAGEVREDVDVVDLAALLSAVPGDERRRRTYLAVVLSGLCPLRR